MAESIIELADDSAPDCGVTVERRPDGLFLQADGSWGASAGDPLPLTRLADPLATVQRLLPAPTLAVGEYIVFFRALPSGAPFDDAALVVGGSSTGGGSGGGSGTGSGSSGPDLVSQDDLAAALAGQSLADAQLALLPALAAAASRLVRKYCNRYFTRRTLDELYTAEGRGPIVLREFPVNSVARVATNPTAVLSVRNTATSTNQRATAALTTTGSADAGLTVTGLTLTRVAAGVTTTSPLLFAAYPTLAALAAAVVALGDGWTAAVASGYALWPTADLRAVQGALPALGRSAELKVHVDDLSFELEPEAGLLHLDPAVAADPWDSPRFGPLGQADWGDPDVKGLPNGLRVVYDAGFDVIPEDVQQAICETVIDMLAALRLDPRLQSETAGAYSYTVSQAARFALTDSVRGKLALYRNNRVA